MLRHRLSRGLPLVNGYFKILFNILPRVPFYRASLITWELPAALQRQPLHKERMPLSFVTALPFFLYTSRYHCSIHRVLPFVSLSPLFSFFFSFLFSQTSSIVLISIARFASNDRSRCHGGDNTTGYRGISSSAKKMARKWRSSCEQQWTFVYE